MEAQRDFLRQIFEALERTHLEYAVTGSWASTTFGAPRTTHDLDVFIAINAEQAKVSEKRSTGRICKSWRLG